MLDQELKDLWQNGPTQNSVQVNTALLLQEVRQEAISVDQKIRKRDQAEITVALLMIPLFAFTAWFMPFPLTKLGAALVVPWCLLIVYKLRRARRQSVQDFSAPIQDYLRQYRTYLQRQEQLLKSLLLWYMLPFTICMVLFFAGFPSSRERLLSHLLIILLMNVLVYAANRHALKTDLQPLLLKIDKTISSLEKA